MDLKSLINILILIVLSQFSLQGQNLSPVSLNSGSQNNSSNIQYSASIGQIFVPTKNTSQQDILSNTLQYQTKIEAKETKIKIYPNPTSDILYFQKHDKNINNIKIIDISGKIIRQINLYSLETGTINISELNTGIYFLKFENLNNKHNFETIKLIKK